MKTILTLLAVSLLTITAQARNFIVDVNIGAEYPRSGTGFLVKAPNGQLIGVTAAHVCEGSTTPLILLRDGSRNYIATLEMVVPLHDVCFFNVDQKIDIPHLALLKIGESQTKMATFDVRQDRDNYTREKKQLVMYAFYPQDRFSKGTEKIEDIALVPINFYNGVIKPGSSGGAVIDDNNKVVGIVIAYNTSRQITYVVPSSIIYRFIGVLR